MAQFMKKYKILPIQRCLAYTYHMIELHKILFFTSHFDRNFISMKVFNIVISQIWSKQEYHTTFYL